MADRQILIRIVGDAGGPGGLLGAVDQADGALGRLGPLAAAAGAAVVAGLGVVAVQGVRAFADFDQGMREVFTLLPGISSDAMGQLEADVRRFSTEMGVATTDAVPALYQALSAGVPQDNVFEFLETAQQAALGGVTDITTAVDGISSVVNAFGDSIGGAGEASDLMFTAVRLGKTTFEELAGSLSNVNPIAAATGVNFGDVTAALATMTAQGVPTAQATTQLRQLFVELGDAGSAAGQAFEDVAGKSLQDFLAAGGDTNEALQLMQQAADGLGVPINQLFGSVEAGSAALALTGSNASTFASNLEEMADSAGATAAAYETMDGGVSRVMERLKVAFDEVLLTVGAALAPTLEQLALWLSENMPAIQAFVTDAMAGISGFITGTVVPAFQSVTTWWEGNGPVVVAAAQQLAAGLQQVWDAIGVALETVRGWLQGLFGEGGSGQAELATFAGNAMAWGQQLIGIFQSAWDAIRAIVSVALTALTNLWRMFGDDLIKFAQGVWSAIQGVISGALNIIQGIFEVFAGVFTGDWTRAWEGIKQIFAGVWETITSITSAAASAIEGIVGVLVQVVQTVWSGFVEGLRDAWDGLWSGITSGFGTVRSTLEGAFRGLVSSLSTIWDGVRGVLAAPINWVAENVINRLSGAINQVSSALGAGNIAPTVAVPLITFHEGGVIGRDGRMTRGPLRPGERIIKAMDGEEVLTVDDPRHRNNQGGRDTLFLESDVAPIGGPFDWIGDVASSAANAARDLITDMARPLINALLGPIESMAGQFGAPGRMVAGGGRKLVEAALAWLGGAEDALPAGQLQGTGWQALVRLVQDSGVPHVVTSTVRSGGGTSYHNSGRAADFSIGGHGNRGWGSAGLRGIFQAFSAVEGQLAELILAGAPYNIKHGRRVGPYAQGTPGSPGNHWNHVHAALEQGGDFDRGGRFLVGESGPEILDVAGRGRVTPLPGPQPADVYLDGMKVGVAVARRTRTADIRRFHRATAGVA